MRPYLWLALGGLLAACDQYDPNRPPPTEAERHEVVRLFEHEGCTLYRFTDHNTWVWYAHCLPGAAATQWTQSCGKSCRREVQVPTDG